MFNSQSLGAIKDVLIDTLLLCGEFIVIQGIYENMPEYTVLCTGMTGILSVPLPCWEGLGEGETGKGFSPPPLSSPIKGEEIVFKEIGKPRPVGGVIHFLMLD